MQKYYRKNNAARKTTPGTLSLESNALKTVEMTFLDIRERVINGAFVRVQSNKMDFDRLEYVIVLNELEPLDLYDQAEGV